MKTKTMDELQTLAVDLGAQLEILSASLPEPQDDSPNHRYVARLLAEQSFLLAGEIEHTHNMSK